VDSELPRQDLKMDQGEFTANGARLSSVAGHYDRDDRRKRIRDDENADQSRSRDPAMVSPRDKIGGDFFRGDQLAQRDWSKDGPKIEDCRVDRRVDAIEPQRLPRDDRRVETMLDSRDSFWDDRRPEDIEFIRERNLREDRRLEAIDASRRDERRGGRGRDDRVIRREREINNRLPYDRDGSGRIVYRSRLREAERERDRARFRERNGGESSAQRAAKPPGPPKERAGEERARKYQLEVLEQAKEKNTIAFLETGAGKTLIAVLLMKSKYELMRKERKKMLAVFLVPKVPLVYQVTLCVLLCSRFLQT
jgi:hypothetical protein